MDYLKERNELRSAPIGAERRRHLSDITDSFLIEIFNNAVSKKDFHKVALIGVGGSGRQSMTLGSDLDLVLVHENGFKIDEIAQKIWYPIWDLGIKLDHSVRTPTQVRNMAAEDIAVVLGWLDARSIVGNSEFEKQISTTVLQDWRAFSDKRLLELHEKVLERKEKFGELAQLIEPDLKESYGGLRDVTVLRSVAATWKSDIPKVVLDQVNEKLLDVRDALHTVLDKPSDKLIRQEQPVVAQKLGFSDADQLIRHVSSLARVIAHHSDVTWHRIKSAEKKSGLFKKLRTENRSPLADGVVLQDDYVVLARDAKTTEDATLGLRLAAAGAQSGYLISPHTLERLANELPTLNTPWPIEARDSFVSLLGSGRQLIPIWESIDFAGLINNWIPVWNRVRGCPQSSQVHSFTVDRHLLETAIHANKFTRDVSRPDLLLVGSLFHDIGKGGVKDHSDEGAEIIKDLAPKMGFEKQDCLILQGLVQHHLLLPETATTRDLEDPLTIKTVVDKVQTEDFLELLHALTLADALATGPMASSDWRQSLIGELVAKVKNELRGERIDKDPHLSKEKQELAKRKEDVIVEANQIDQGLSLTIVVEDRTGLLGLIAGVLSVHRLLVRSARTETINNKAVTTWRVTPEFGDAPNLSQIQESLRLALNGQLDVFEKLALRVQYLPQPVSVTASKILEIKGISNSATVIEVRAHDEPGFLSKIAHAISETGVDIQAAIVETLGSEVVDVFYVKEPNGEILSDKRCQELVQALDYACNHVPATI
ncbi:MAG: [protein-PII] uridylyltransferase [Actinomycetota bacterium]|nr:[protein-PII] uridylyltransferase [Actinomycetota bacterium]